MLDRIFVSALTCFHSHICEVKAGIFHCSKINHVETVAAFWKLMHSRQHFPNYPFVFVDKLVNEEF